MSRFLLLNFEDFTLTQDITKTIQPRKHFCICCLDVNGPMVDLDKCSHKDYLDAFDKPQVLQQINQLVCLQCHSVLKKIKCFQVQVLESYNILLSGTFTNATANVNRLNSLIIQKVVDDLHLPPDTETSLESYNKHIPESSNENSQQNSPNVDENYTQELAKLNNAEGNVICQKNQLNIQDNFEHGLDSSILDNNYTQGIRRYSLDENLIHGTKDISSLDKIYTNGIRDSSSLDKNYTHGIRDSPSEENFIHGLKNDTSLDKNYTYEIRDGFNRHENYTCGVRGNDLESNFTHAIKDNSTLDKNYKQEIRDSSYSNIIKEEKITHQMENYSNISNEHEFIQQHNRLNIEMNKNIKTALEILERNNQSFVTLGSQLQFLNGEHLSYLEPSLLSKEILTDIPLVPAKSMSTDLENALLHNSKSLDIEIDGPDKMFYDSLDLSPGLGKESNLSEMIKIEIDEPMIQNEIEPKIEMDLIKPRKVRKVKKNITPLQVKIVKLSQEQLNRERVLQAQSDGYLRHKFRCETCLIGFNYQENLKDHNIRKHGTVEAVNVICDICSQVVPTICSMTEHNYRHYTRYECLQCSTRFQTKDEAIQHCIRKLCSKRDYRSSLNRE